MLRTVRASLDGLKASRGRLAIIGSVAGYIATPGASPYSMSKFAVSGLAQALSYELAPAGVSVTLLTPGYVESELRRVDNRGVFRAESREPISAWLVMPAPRAARQIVRAIAHRRREVVITGHGKLGVFMQRHAPWLVAATIRLAGLRARPEPVQR